jgi:hypothetical protein
VLVTAGQLPSAATVGCGLGEIFESMSKRQTPRCPLRCLLPQLVKAIGRKSSGMAPSIENAVVHRGKHTLVLGQPFVDGSSPSANKKVLRYLELALHGSEVGPEPAPRDRCAVEGGPSKSSQVGTAAVHTNTVCGLNAVSHGTTLCPTALCVS